MIRSAMKNESGIVGAISASSWIAAVACALIFSQHLYADEVQADADEALCSATVLSETVVDEAWDAVFNRTDGWVGGDAIYSTLLPGERVLWLFADTMLGQVKDGRRQPGLQMVNNSLALNARPPRGAAPDSKEVHFFWGSSPEAEKATSWIVPDPALLPGHEAAAAREWYWLGDAFVAPGARGQDRLLVFMWRVASADKQAVFGFRTVGSALAVIENPADEPAAWKPRQFVITHAVPASSADETRDPHVCWGSESLLLEEAGQPPQVVIYGYRSCGKDALELIAARAPAASIEDMSQWEFRTADGWSASLAEAAPLAERLTTEFSVSRHAAADGTPLWVLVNSEPNLGEAIYARTARSPFGPWSTVKTVYHVPGVDREKKHFTYAAKAHPELSAAGELLISYVVNSFDFAEGLTNAGIYRPRFVRAPITLLPPPPDASR